MRVVWNRHHHQPQPFEVYIPVETGAGGVSIEAGRHVLIELLPKNAYGLFEKIEKYRSLVSSFANQGRRHAFT
jgi:hypothetical protein